MFQLSPILSILLVHDLLLAKRGVALPAVHGLRTAVERHRGRLQAELTKARIRRKLSTIEALKAHIETGVENSADGSEAPYPRWVRINTVKTTLEDQLDTIFKGYERAKSVNAVRQRGSKLLFIDQNVPNLVAVSPTVELVKSEAYKNGQIIFQDKASCFPAYLLDPLTQDGDIIDSCSAPGNKTTHIAAILLSHSADPEECKQVIHAFEKNKGRAETLERMVNVAGSNVLTKLHPGQDFLKTDPTSAAYKKVGALLLDPSCSGSGIVGRDDMPELHLPAVKQVIPTANGKKGFSKPAEVTNETRKRKREDKHDLLDVMVDDDGVVTAVNTDDELKVRLEALSTFQLDLLLHAFKFPAASKITYSTCSIHAEENEMVVQKALKSPIAKERGWRLLRRDEQVSGMKQWRVRGSKEACEGDSKIADACIRANKGDENGTMGFFLAGFVRDRAPVDGDVDESKFLRDERGHMVRDVLGYPVMADAEEIGDAADTAIAEEVMEVPEDVDDWDGFGEEDVAVEEKAEAKPEPQKKKAAPSVDKHSFGNIRTGLVPKGKKRRKGKA